MPLDDVPQVYTRHAFLCVQERPPGHPRGSCGAQGARPLFEHLVARVERLGSGTVGATASGCFGFCAAGPIMVVYPDGVWYRPRSKDDIDRIVDTHLVGGELVADLAVMPRV